LEDGHLEQWMDILFNSAIGGLCAAAVVTVKNRSNDQQDGATTVSNAAAARQAILSSTFNAIAGHTARLPITSKQKAASVARS